VTLHIQQSVARHIEELARRGLAPGGSFEDVMRHLGDDRRRRRLAWCFAGEDRAAARRLSFTGEDLSALAGLGPASLDVAPVWIPSATGLGAAPPGGSWGAAICVQEPEAVAALVSLPEAVRASVREVSFASRSEAMTAAITAEAPRWSFPALSSLEVRGARGAAGAAALLARRSPGLRRFAVSAVGPEGGLLDALAELSSLEALELLILADGERLAKSLGGLPLRRLTLHGTEVTNGLADAIAALPDLEAFSLRSSGTKKAPFKRLAKGLGVQARLREIDLRGCALLDAKTLEALGPLSAVIRVRVEGEGLDGAFLPVLAGAKLVELELVGVSVKAPAVQWIAAQEGLTRLRLSHTGVTADTVASFAALPRLAVLHLKGGRLSPALPTLCAMPRLFRLRLDLHADDEPVLIAAPPPAALQELDVDGVSLSPRGAAALAAWPLAGLNACSDAMYERKVLAQMGTAGAKELSRCSSLEWLHLGCQQIDGEGAGALAALPRLRWLHLSQNPLGDGVARLSGAQALRVVYLDRADLGPGAPSSLAKMGALEEINAWDNRIDGTHLADFAHLPNLRDLNLAGNAIPPEAAEALRRLLPRAKIVV
jgi:hypothetical protein